MNPVEVGLMIKKERVQKGMTLRELGDLSKTSAATICRIENGKRLGNAKSVFKIAKTLGISIDIPEEKEEDRYVNPDGLIPRLMEAINTGEDPTPYDLGFRNGILYALYLITGKEVGGSIEIPDLDEAIKKLLIRKLSEDPTWMATSYGINETTDIHVLVERFENGKHYYGTSVTDIS